MAIQTGKAPRGAGKPQSSQPATPQPPLAAAASARTARAGRLPNSLVGRTPAFIEPERRGALIAEAAYYRAERRGFESGHEIEDWLAAEGEIDGMLTRGEIPLARSV